MAGKTVGTLAHTEHPVSGAKHGVFLAMHLQWNTKQPTVIKNALDEAVKTITLLISTTEYTSFNILLYGEIESAHKAFPLHTKVQWLSPLKAPMRLF